MNLEVDVLYLTLDVSPKRIRQKQFKFSLSFQFKTVGNVLLIDYCWAFYSFQICDESQRLAHRRQVPCVYKKEDWKRLHSYNTFGCKSYREIIANPVHRLLENILNSEWPDKVLGI